MPADDAVAWVGTALTPLVLIAEYRLRRALLVGRWLSIIDPPRQWPCWFSHILLLSGLPPLICPETQKSAGSMVLRNQQTDTLTFLYVVFLDANHLGSALPAASKIRRKRSVRIHINLLKKLQKSCEICNFTAFRGGPEGIRTFDLSDANELKALICIDFYPFPPLFPGM